MVLTELAIPAQTALLEKSNCSSLSVVGSFFPNYRKMKQILVNSFNVHKIINAK